MDYKVQRALLIRFSSLGDIVLTTPVMQAIKDAFPWVKTYILIKRIYRALVPLMPHLDGAILFDKRKQHILDIVKQVNLVNFDVLLDLHRNLRSAVLFSLCRARYKLMYRKYSLKRLLMINFKMKFKPLHTVGLYLSALKDLGIDNFFYRPILRIPPALVAWAKNLIGCENTVAVIPFARYKLKQWHTHGFLEIINYLTQSLGFKVVLLGKCSLAEAEAYKDLDGKNIINLINKIDLAQLGAVLERCCFTLCNDSGPMHMATALSVPVIAIFGPTSPQLGFEPFGENNIVVQLDLPCRPCSFHGEGRCKMNNWACMNDITAQIVKDAILRMLSCNLNVNKKAL